MAKKKSWFSLVKRIFVSDKRTCQKEKKNKWGFGGAKVKKLPSLPAPQKKLREAEDEQTEPALVLNIKQISETAATTIQTAFRGYLARKALEALKGIVKLQALIRGRAVRRHIINIHTQPCHTRLQTSYENKQRLVLGDKLLKTDSGCGRRWDDSILSKKTAEAMIMSKKEAAMKRERIKEYSILHRKSAESERKKVNARLVYWLEQWGDTQVSKDLYTIRPSRRYSDEFGRTTQIRLTKNPTEQFDMNMNSANGIPKYMAATQSARARARSVSTPKQRGCESCSECYSPYKSKLSHVTERSPRVKAIAGSVGSIKMGKDLNFDSDCSFPIWDRQFR